MRQYIIDGLIYFLCKFSDESFLSFHTQRELKETGIRIDTDFGWKYTFVFGEREDLGHESNTEE